MTKNQIEYQKHLETKRSNLANEALTSWRDRTTASLKSQELSEVARHNLAYETETSRHNRSTESETNRHNLVVEGQSLVSLGLQARDVATREKQAETQYGQLEVSQRQAAVSERLADIQSERLNIDRDQLAISRLLASINQQDANTRAYLANIQSRLADETVRSNIARETETYRSNIAREDETKRSNIAREDETYRSNIASESIASRNADTSAKRATIESVLAQSQVLTDQSRRNQMDAQTSYYGQENVRDWIGTIGSTVRDVSTSALNITRAINLFGGAKNATPFTK